MFGRKQHKHGSPSSLKGKNEDVSEYECDDGWTGLEIEKKVSPAHKGSQPLSLSFTNSYLPAASPISEQSNEVLDEYDCDWTVIKIGNETKSRLTVLGVSPSLPINKSPSHLSPLISKESEGASKGRVDDKEGEHIDSTLVRLPSRVEVVNEQETVEKREGEEVAGGREAAHNKGAISSNGQGDSAERPHNLFFDCSRFTQIFCCFFGGKRQQDTSFNMEKIITTNTNTSIKKTC